MHVDIILNEFASVAEAAELSVLAESYGARAVWSSSYGSDRSPFLVLARAAAVTKHVRLGPLAVSPMEMHPLLMCNTLLTLNEMCGGRATITVGGGGGVLQTMGLTRTRVAKSVTDCLEILRAALSGDVVNYPGEIYKVVAYHPGRWATDTPPEIYVGAERPRNIFTATRLADGIMRSDLTPDMMRETIAHIEAGLATHGRTGKPFGISNFWAWHIKKDKAEAEYEARRELILRGLLQTHHTEVHLSQADSDLVQEKKGAFWKAYFTRSGKIEGIPEAIVTTLIDKMSSTGDLNDLEREIERMREFKAAGLTEIALRVHDDPVASIKLIGEHVIPAVQ
ncbi:MAG: LLM class flavin-dependent oxidoreductase [Gammaproteobacteria bacterium]|nr:MAG: LLM class flavin-dependent oxidoreductase [Gammaproteobacteria bacterium]